MSRIHNRRAKRAHARDVYAEAFDFHTARTIQLAAAGRLDKLNNSGYARRQRRRARTCRSQ